jgi:radical SAM protein with 4Fe4S-binding SPASM domain
MLRYKIREEKTGCTLFDAETGRVRAIEEAEYQRILARETEQHGALHAEDGQPLFRVYRSSVARQKLPEDCLSAPSKVYLELTRRCTYCYNRSGENPPEEIDERKVEALLEQLEAMGTFEIRLTGGEPTLHPGFFRIAKRATDAGFYVSVGSNGVWAEGTAEGIVNSGVRAVILSVDGGPEHNDRMRGRGAFDAATRAARTVRAAGRIRLQLNCVLSKLNRDQISSVVKTAESLAADDVNFGLMKPSGRGSALRADLLEPHEVLGIVSEITRMRAQTGVRLRSYYDVLDGTDSPPSSRGSLLNRSSCAAGIEAAAVSPRGEVYGCVVSPANLLSDCGDKRLFVAGHIDQDPFPAIWLDSSRWTVYRNMAVTKDPACLRCRFHTVRCFGNCVVDSFLHGGQPNSKDPYCFVHLLEQGTRQ